MDGGLNEKFVRLTLQDHVDGGRTPVEAAGEVRWLDEVMVQQNIVPKETAEESRHVIDRWLAEMLKLSPEEMQPHMQLADQYTQFLHEKVVTRPHQMPDASQAWREWRQARGSE